MILQLDDIDSRPTKQCKNCKYAKGDWVIGFMTLGLCFWKYAKCQYFTAHRNYGGDSYCSVQRRYECGKEAKFFEPK